ncbi:hypothetical protein N657DRAFT_582933 [Parathielavia appendiculata]|uniref:Rhodopsin domain-containing protein n=1 Tax=Parathielavia appendiculata TaxID=2587402 RepID=A0AAN6TQK3_9PEZI|nr:hypothetical protein N657DRAFT_582933 [Parathielavia appendiculata]
MSSSHDAARSAPANDANESATIIACSVVLLGIAAVAVGLRFYVRARLVRSVKIEDWCMLLSLAFAILASTFLIKQAQAGLGRPFSTLLPDDVMAFRKWAWFQGVFYYLSFWFTKMSILLLYLRVLTHDYIRKATWAVIAIVVVYNVYTFAMHVTMCIPLAKNWDPSITGGYCHAETGHGQQIFWAVIYLHIITDFMIFAIPIPVVAAMTIPLRQKLGLLFVFTVGFFVCLVSIVRAALLHRLINAPDVTWDLIQIANWSSAELNVSIVCGCMPTLRPLLAKAFGPLMDRFFPEPHQSLTDVNDEQPRTIGSMPLKAFRFGRQSKEKGSRAAAPPSATSWAQEETLANVNLETARNGVHSKGMDSDAELIAGGNEVEMQSSHWLKEPSMVHARG